MHVFVLWLCFLLGNIIHLLQQGKATSARTGIAFEDWVQNTYWIALTRTAFAGAIFALWITGAGAVLNMIAKLFGITLPNIPPNGATALMFGLCTDWGLNLISERIPALQRIIPAWTETKTTVTDIHIEKTETTPVVPPTAAAKPAGGQP